MDLKAIAHLARFKDIIATLLKFGFDDAVERLELPGTVRREKALKPDPSLSTWKRIRLALEDLGPTFVKFGQIMSLRPDLIPVALIRELEKLQDDVMPVSFEQIRRVVEAGLDRPFSEVFPYFEEKPLAAASLAQVHRASLEHEGRLVAVKVRRPDIEQIVDTDLYILETVARYLSDRFEMARFYDVPGLVREFKRSLLRELDFTNEARNMTMVRNNFSDSTDIYIPFLYREFCNETMLTMELIDGLKLKDLPPDALGDRELLARRGVRAVIKQVLEDGLFHADPHPGNLLITRGNVICFLDWGTVGRLTQDVRFELVDLINAVVDRDVEKALDILLGLSASRITTVDERRVLRDLLDIIDTYRNIPIGDLNVGSLLLEVNALLRNHKIRVPTDLAVMIKALITAEGTARRLYPDLNAVDEATPYVKKLAIERWKPEVVWRRMRRSLYHVFALQKQLPQRLRHIIEKIELGDLHIRLEHEELDGLRNTLENMTNRLTFGIITAAMIIGSSMIITTGIKPLLFGYPALGIIGYLGSGVLGLWLVVNIIRTRKF